MSDKYIIGLDLLQEIADAIRLKTDDTNLIFVKDFPANILNITGGTVNIISKIDELGNVSVYGFNSFDYENENVIIS